MRKRRVSSWGPSRTLIEPLQEESTDDMDYYIDHDTLDLFEARGAEAALLALLRQALGTRDGIEIVWSRA
jgi:hypothetical protein